MEKDCDDSVSPHDSSEDESEEFSKDKKISPKNQTIRSKPVVRKWIVYISLFILVAGTIIAVYYPQSQSATENHSEQMQELKKLTEAWRINYPNQSPETWSTIVGPLMEFVGVAHMSPLVFVMAYDEAVETTKILASEITRAALRLKFEPDDCGDQDIAKISGHDAELKPGFLLNHFITKIKKCRKMIMYNLEKLNGSVAKELHSLLDNDFPNLHKVVYIFTVRVPNVKGNAYYQVHNTLRTRWGGEIEDDVLNPLLSRLVNNVKIIPESVFEL